MGEVVDFAAFASKKREEKAIKSDSERDPEEGPSLDGILDIFSKLEEMGIEIENRPAGGLSVGLMKKMLEIRKGISNSGPISQQKLQEQRDAIRDWSREKAIEFIENPNNDLLAKPHFALAVIEKAMGPAF